MGVKFGARHDVGGENRSYGGVFFNRFRGADECKDAHGTVPASGGHVPLNFDHCCDQRGLSRGGSGWRLVIICRTHALDPASRTKSGNLKEVKYVKEYGTGGLCLPDMIVNILF